MGRIGIGWCDAIYGNIGKFTDETSYDELCESNPRKKADEQWLCPLGVFSNLYHLEYNAQSEI